MSLRNLAADSRFLDALGKENHNMNLQQRKNADVLEEKAKPTIEPSAMEGYDDCRGIEEESGH
jgi:hypothetical protein